MRRDRGRGIRREVRPAGGTASRRVARAIGAGVVLLVLAAGCRVRKLDDPSPPPSASASSAPVARTTPDASAPAPPSAQLSPAPPKVEAGAIEQGTAVVALAGVHGQPDLTDVCVRAVDRALLELTGGTPPIATAARAIAELEADGRAAAGVGAPACEPGAPADEAAIVMDSTGSVGAVAQLNDILNPARAAAAAASDAGPGPLLVGPEANALAERAKLARLPVAPTELDDAGTGDAGPRDAGNSRAAIDAGDAGDAAADAATNANDAAVPPEPGPVAVLLRTPDGRFAGAVSGGALSHHCGSVSPWALPGVSLYVGQRGAVAISATSPDLYRIPLARLVYERLDRMRSAKLAVRWALDTWQDGAPIGVVVLADRDIVIDSRGPMPFAERTHRGERHRSAESGR